MDNLHIVYYELLLCTVGLIKCPHRFSRPYVLNHHPPKWVIDWYSSLTATQSPLWPTRKTTLETSSSRTTASLRPHSPPPQSSRKTIASKKTATVGSIRFASRNSTAVVWHNSATPLLRRVLHQVHPDRNHNGALACLSLKYDDFCFILERDIQIKVEDFGLRWRENKKSRKKCRCRITSLVTVSDIR